MRPTIGSPAIAPTEPAPTPVEPAATRPPAAPESTLPAVRPAFTLGVEPVASGFERPTYVTHAGDDRLFVVEQAGSIWIIEDGAVLDVPFLSIASKVNSRANERGLLSVAFDPDYTSNGFFYVNYTRQPDGATVIERYQVSDNPDVADPESGAVLLTIDQPEANHNGGQLQFGPDGYLYIGTGDGGGAGDRHGEIGNGQDDNALLGKMLRMHVRSGEVSIWAKGLRNPWRFSFDRATGDLYIADVGQNVYEEVNFQAASSAGGENYGWRIMEGNHCFNPREGCDQSGLTPPVAEYDHGSGCSITGGAVYRGAAYPGLDGLYFFADYCSGIMWSLERDPSGRWNMAEQMRVNFNVSSFGEDEAGEVYLAGHDDGTIYRLTSASP
ncbi:MAG TPA: PQQ-dependent sugar dehydrogenase [Anaerolineae bacterium]|nr:PQQ-dependent sugar dehydrogenase [Anaerolineae bacterium]